MFIVLLKFSDKRPMAASFMAAHNDWIRQGFTDDVFLLIGSLQAGRGGAILAHNTSLPELQSRVEADPFVVEHIVRAEILEVAPAKADDRMRFLLPEG